MSPVCVREGFRACEHGHVWWLVAVAEGRTFQADVFHGRADDVGLLSELRAGARSRAWAFLEGETA